MKTIFEQELKKYKIKVPKAQRQYNELIENAKNTNTKKIIGNDDYIEIQVNTTKLISLKLYNTKTYSDFVKLTNYFRKYVLAALKRHNIQDYVNYKAFVIYTIFTNGISHPLYYSPSLSLFSKTIFKDPSLIVSETIIKKPLSIFQKYQAINVKIYKYDLHN